MLVIEVQPDFLASQSTVAENMYSTRKELLLLGDINMDMYESRDESCFPADTRLVDFCNQLCLKSNHISVHAVLLLKENEQFFSGCDHFVSFLLASYVFQKPPKLLFCRN